LLERKHFAQIQFLSLMKIKVYEYIIILVPQEADEMGKKRKGKESERKQIASEGEQLIARRSEFATSLYRMKQEYALASQKIEALPMAPICLPSTFKRALFISKEPLICIARTHLLIPRFTDRA